MIYGSPGKVGIQLELVVVYGTAGKHGMLNFIIDQKLVPGRGTFVGFYPTIEELRESLINGLEKCIPDMGPDPLEKLKPSEGEFPNAISLDAAFLSDLGCCFWLGFDDAEDRFLYSTDYEETIQEKRYPRGTIEKLIRSLPKTEEIEFCSREAINIFTYFQLSSAERHKPSMPALRGGNHGLLDEFGNEWLDCTHGDSDKVKWNVMLTPKWQKKFGWPSIALEHFKHCSGTQVPLDKGGKEAGLYYEIEIVAVESIEEAYRGYIGRRGVVLGLSEAEGIVYGYGVYFRDGKMDEFLTFAVDEVVATGICFEREAFYDGSYGCLSPERELLNLHVAGACNQHNEEV